MVKDAENITDKCDEAIKWLDANQLAEIDEFNENRRRLRVFATQISPSPTLTLEEPQEECLTLEMLDQPSKMLINTI